MPDSSFSTDHMARTLALLAPLLFAPLLFAEVLNAGDDLFNDHVGPIFAARCLTCHNDADRQGDFSLQTAEALRESGYVTPSDAANSHLLDVITSADKAPPAMPKEGEPLTSEEVAIIRQWIDASAHWPAGLRLEEPAVERFDWWSYQPLERPPIPQVDDAALRNPIDVFVLRELQDNHLSLSPPADRRTLIRRVTFDLIGLPPTPAEVAAFLSDDDPRAYEKLVDRLLASPRYGERWSRHWLDVVKYADTHGYDKDKLRPHAWPYRDYVVRSFNEDKPYTRFVQEQVAGDVLFPGEPDGILGLGFLAAGPWDWIGHAEVPETKLDGRVARHLDRDEMVGNTLNTFCSLTVQCARCHNHKFDPITQRHYYNLQAVFAAVDRADRPYDLDPAIEQRRRELTVRQTELAADQKALDQSIAADAGPRLAQLDEQIAPLQEAVALKPKRPQFGYHSQISATQQAEKWVQVDLGEAVSIRKLTLRPAHDEFNDIGAGFGFPLRFTVAIGPDADSLETIAHETAADVPNPGLTPYEMEFAPRTARIIRVTATKLAPRQNDFILALAELQVTDAQGEIVPLSDVTALDSIEAPVRWTRANLIDGIWPESIDPAGAKRFTQLKAEREALWAKHLTPARAERLEAIVAERRQNDKELADLPEGKLVYAAATHFAATGTFKPTEGTPRDIHVLHRGEILKPGAIAQPGTVPLLQNDESGRNDETVFAVEMDAGEGDRRAALARWLTAETNPLTWRSIVNRVWLHHFSKGLVSTPNDFGRMGAEPTHAELLDWLAVEFRDGGQSFKTLHRLIVSSDVYRQSSAHNAHHAEIDRSNRYLWRMNRRRLSAEEVRDAILSVSGSLDLTMGGPGDYLFVLEKTAHSPHYEYHKFDPATAERHRRSIYRFIARSQPDPYMSTLDCADSSQSTPQRIETITSLQALSLLNNRFMLEMSRRFAERLETEEPGIAEQIELGLRLTCGRPATTDEQHALQAYAAKHGLKNLCRVLLNLSEFVYVE